MNNTLCDELYKGGWRENLIMIVSFPSSRLTITKHEKDSIIDVIERY